MQENRPNDIRGMRQPLSSIHVENSDEIDEKGDYPDINGMKRLKVAQISCFSPLLFGNEVEEANQVINHFDFIN